MMIKKHFELKGIKADYAGKEVSLPSISDAWKVIALRSSIPNVIVELEDLSGFSVNFEELASSIGFNILNGFFLSLPVGNKDFFIERGRWLRVEEADYLNIMDLCLIDEEPDFVIIDPAVKLLMAVTTEEDGLYVFWRSIDKGV